MSSDPNCVFCKIVEGKIPSRKVYEDDDLFAFHDIAPWAPVHFMMVPKKHIASMAQLTPDDAALMGKIMTLAPGSRWSRAAGLIRRAASASSSTPATEGGQEVHHLHVHVMGGPRPWLRG
jgi:histidine triad (HIT) family protein